MPQVALVPAPPKRERSIADVVRDPFDLLDSAGSSKLTPEQRRRAEERMRLLAPVLDASSRSERRRAAQVAAEQAGKSIATIYRWIDRVKNTSGGPNKALVRRSRSDRGRTKLPVAALDMILALSLPAKDRGPLTASQVHRIYTREAANRGWPKISTATVRRILADSPSVIRRFARVGPRSADAIEMPVARRAYDMAPLELVVMDHRMLDVPCLFPTGRGGAVKVGRPWMTAAIDMRTRRWLAWLISEQPDAEAIVSVVRRVVVQFGVPDKWYWDNGQDFDSVRVRQIVEQAMPSKVVHAAPYNARAKLIEPNFRRWSQNERLLPEWLGNRPELRPERVESINAAKLKPGTPRVRPMHEIAEIYSDLLRAANIEPLEGEGMMRQDDSGHWRPRSPLEVWDELAPLHTRQSIPAEDLVWLFARRIQVTVRQGEVRLRRRGRTIWYRPMPAEHETRLLARNGRRVDVLVDPHDETSAACVDPSGEFISLLAAAPLRSSSVDDGYGDDIARRARVTRDVQGIVDRVAEFPAPDALESTRSAAREAYAERVEPEQSEVFLLSAAPGEAAAEQRRIRATRPAAVTAETQQPDEGDYDFFGDRPRRR